jgi:hypothetical protein
VLSQHHNSLWWNTAQCPFLSLATLRLPSVRALSARLLTSGLELLVSPADDGIFVQGPTEAPDKSVTVIALSEITKEA